MLILVISRCKMERLVSALVFLFFSNLLSAAAAEVQAENLAEKNALLNPADLQRALAELEKIWTSTQPNERPPKEETNSEKQSEEQEYGIQLKASDASIALVGQITKLKVLTDESVFQAADKKLVIKSGNRRVLRVLTKEIVLNKKKRDGNESRAHEAEESEHNIVVLGIKPGRASLLIKASQIIQKSAADSPVESCMRKCLKPFAVRICHTTLSETKNSTFELADPPFSAKTSLLYWGKMMDCCHQPVSRDLKNLL